MPSRAAVRHRGEALGYVAQVIVARWLIGRCPKTKSGSTHTKEGKPTTTSPVRSVNDNPVDDNQQISLTQNPIKCLSRFTTLSSSSSCAGGRMLRVRFIALTFT